MFEREDYSIKHLTLLSILSMISYIISLLVFFFVLTLYQINSVYSVEIFVHSNINIIVSIMLSLFLLSIIPCFGYSNTICSGKKNTDMKILTLRGFKEIGYIFMSLIPVFVFSIILYYLATNTKHYDFMFFAFISLIGSLYIMPAYLTSLRDNTLEDSIDEMREYVKTYQYFKDCKETSPIIIKYIIVLLLSIIFPILTYIIFCFFIIDYSLAWSKRYEKFKQ